MWSVHSGEGIAESLKDRRSLQAGILEGILENLEREAVPENPEPSVHCEPRDRPLMTHQVYSKPASSAGKRS